MFRRFQLAMVLVLLAVGSGGQRVAHEVLAHGENHGHGPCHHECLDHDDAAEGHGHSEHGAPDPSGPESHDSCRTCMVLAVASAAHLETLVLVTVDDAPYVLERDRADEPAPVNSPLRLRARPPPRA